MEDALRQLGELADGDDDDRIRGLLGELLPEAQLDGGPAAHVGGEPHEAAVGG